MKLEISKEFTFEASHILPRHPGKCSRLHGHSWKLLVAVEGEIVDETGFVLDYAVLKGIVQPVVDSLDHKHLGSKLNIPSEWCAPTVSGSDFYPSSENLIIWIGSQLDAQVKFPLWSRLELNETCTSKCVLTREEYDKRPKVG